MREIGPCARGRFLILSVVLSLGAVISVGREGVAGEEPVRIAAAGTDVFDLHGTVRDAPDFRKAFDKLEAALEDAQPESPEDFEEAFREAFNGIGGPEAAANVVVTLRGQSLTKKTHTDSEGSFTFAALPAGEYELSARAPSRPTPVRGVRRTATAKAQIALGPSTPKVSLELSTMRVAIRGRIKDAQGTPIAGATVTAVLDIHTPSFEGRLEVADAPAWSAVTDADGSYELEGMEPANTYHLIGALAGGKALREFVDIHAEADGYAQTERPREVPLVTEDVVILARRFLRIFNLWSRKTGNPERPEKGGLPFPASQDNTIAGIDIVLHRADAVNEGDEERRPTGSTSAVVSADFVEIRIESHPQGWGYAHKTVQPDGSIIGAHQSGGPDAVRVYETKSEVTPDDMEELKNLVSALRGRSLPAVARPDQQSEGYRSVIIVTGEDTELTAYAKGEEEFEPQEMQRIWDLVIKYKVGAW